MNLQITDEEAALLERELRNIIDKDRCPFLLRILQTIRDKIRPEPKPKPVAATQNYKPAEPGDIGDGEILFRPTYDARECGICLCPLDRVVSRLPPSS